MIVNGGCPVLDGAAAISIYFLLGISKFLYKNIKIS